jgi:hypothetical protein
MKKFYFTNHGFNLIMLLIWSCIYMQANQLEAAETFSSNLHLVETNTFSSENTTNNNRQITENTSLQNTITMPFVKGFDDTKDSRSAFPQDWQYRLPVIISDAVIDENLSNFTLVLTDEMLTVLASPNGPLDGDGSRPSRNGGGDIRFSADEAGTQQLAVDIRSWNTATGDGELAVKVPVISGSTTTTIYLWWGNAQAEQPAAGEVFGQYEAYDAATLMSLSDGSSATGRTSSDAARTWFNVGTPDAIEAPNGLSARSYVQAQRGNSPASEYSHTSALWGSGTVTSRTIRGMMQYNDGEISVLAYEGSSSSGSSLAPQVWVTSNTEEIHFAGVIRHLAGLPLIVHPLTEGPWYAFAFTYDYANKTQRMYINGELVQSTVQTGIGSMPSNVIFSLGAQGALFNYGWHGGISHFSADNTTRSAAWIKAESANLLTPASLLSNGEIEDLSADQSIVVNNPDKASVSLELQSNQGGLLIPRISNTQRDGLPSPAAGLLIFNNTTQRLNYWTGTAWNELSVAFVSDVTGETATTNGVAVNLSGSTAAPSAIFDVDATDKGFLLSRTVPASILNPEEGMIIYNNSENEINYFNGTNWITPCFKQVSASAGVGTSAGVGVLIGDQTDMPHNSAMVELSDQSKALLLSRLTNAHRDMP